MIYGVEGGRKGCMLLLVVIQQNHLRAGSLFFISRAFSTFFLCREFLFCPFASLPVGGRRSPEPAESFPPRGSSPRFPTATGRRYFLLMGMLPLSA